MIDTDEAALEVLTRVFGHAAFRPGQAEIIKAAIGGEDIFAILPSGAGKSLLYQLPAVLNPGLTVVISPLIALMRDQVLALRARGIKAAMLNSLNDEAEDRLAFGGLARKELKLLYLSPEHFAGEASFDRLARSDIACIVVDEAHCIVHWGHDFRPEYREIGPLAAELAATRPTGRLQIMAMTATADAATRAAVVEGLFQASPRLFVASFDRPNIRIAFTRRRAADRQMRAFVAAHQGETGIIYCATRRHAEDMAKLLKAAGHRALAYHAGLDDEMRARAEKAFREEACVVIVATIAFGMGVDRPDVRFIGHADTPRSVESYYQEIGRAGRDGLPANALALFDPADLTRWRAGLAFKDDRAAELARHKSLARLCRSAGCRRRVLLRHFGEESRNCGRCDRCEAGIIGRALGFLRLN